MLLVKKASGKTLLSYRYDELGRKISQTDITGRQVSYKFDKSNRLVDICNEIDQSIVSFTRDADSAIQKITHANGMWQDIAYDADKNIVSLTVATPDKILAQNSYRYDGNGQRSEKNELTGQRSTPTPSSTACSRRNIQPIRNDSPTITPATA
ncbi:RHS repeat protein [Selenomonas caprae]|uniref:RHS repeat protein n=1 Tax=Selenomonas caprae TaxID=2606905 RepID=A0A5D6WT43_9FIRM|nr:RHS repeat protein [Selenomonas caprae]